MAQPKHHMTDENRIAMTSAVRAAIAQAGMTQTDLAEAADITINTLSRRLNGWSDFTWPELISIADATGMTVLDLVTSAQRIAARTLAAVS